MASGYDDWTADGIGDIDQLDFDNTHAADGVIADGFINNLAIGGLLDSEGWGGLSELHDAGSGTPSPLTSGRTFLPAETLTFAQRALADAVEDEAPLSQFAVVAEDRGEAAAASSFNGSAGDGPTPQDARKKRTRPSDRSMSTATGEPKAKRVKREPVSSALVPPATPAAGLAMVITEPFCDPTAKARAAAAKEKRKARTTYLGRFIPVWRRPPGYEPPFNEKSAQWQADRAKCVADRANRSHRVSGRREGGKFCATGQWISAPAISAPVKVEA